MALTKTPLDQVSPRNPTIFTRWKRVKETVLEATKRHQALYHGSVVHLAGIACLVATSAVLEAFQRASIGWYLLCGTMVVGYWFDLKDQRNRLKKASKDTSEAQE